MICDVLWRVPVHTAGPCLTENKTVMMVSNPKPKEPYREMGVYSLKLGGQWPVPESSQKPTAARQRGVC